MQNTGQSTKQTFNSIKHNVKSLQPKMAAHAQGQLLRRYLARNVNCCTQRLKLFICTCNSSRDFQSY